MSTHKHQCGLITVDKKGDTLLVPNLGCHHVWEHETGPQEEHLSEKVARHKCPQCGMGPWYAFYNPKTRLRGVLAVAALLALNACAVVPPPKVCFANLDHLSHPLQGHPFMGSREEEDAVNALGTTCRWEKGRVFIESGLSYQLPGSDLYGDDLLFNSRLGVKIWERQ